ncbi:hypothetical protein LMG26411_05796 [Cupriavidus numazuensis]|uniref:KfrA N-terminal DNA-binding domain-containing protein n=2 Tax=Cupriavidus numazuensis TaxID=221992 RepID=A0ABM8TQC7_9BURK|nr:hypothetical protein LMG26411_05796 [Cupriavidus numazuensis]
MPMTTQQYYDHTVEGSATLLSDDTWQATGCVVRAGAVLVESGELGFYRTRERAQAQGLAWAKSWIDMHTSSEPAEPEEAEEAPCAADGDATVLQHKILPRPSAATDCARRQLLDLERHICEVRSNLRRQIRFARQLRADGLPTEFTEMLLHTLCHTVASLRKQRNRLRQQVAAASRVRSRSR